MKEEVRTTDEILRWPSDAQNRLKTELGDLMPRAFPKMPREHWQDYVSDFFRRPGYRSQRPVILYRNEEGGLVGAAIFDHGEIESDCGVRKGIYILSRSVLPEYQGYGLGQKMAVRILMDFRPDLLLTTCTQSSSVYSWILLPEKGLVTGFEVYPRLERRDEKEMVITLPHDDLDFTIHAFRQLFAGVVNGNLEKADQAASNLTALMVRRAVYEERYDFDPWGRHGREDTLAKALGLRNGDGVLVVFKKKR